ncbi:hypothetical protein BESB_076920 [Besnoitia besnoiti]|uniref:PIH1D1/2/3 CS-like domain-containing protein n=1 Tax=Besnoitia besnoiti TaxID=94643 RepID=A0A2A9M674_BESBE|nr:hypothetical protein BESB_076920 [Besnoitia besnoiti]PFH33475.1 hypothetical protein BESB_076920 [Besnoitia besnoiti]
MSFAAAPPAAGIAQQAQALWAMLDDLAESDPERYRRFIQQQMEEARGAQGAASSSSPSSSSSPPPLSSSPPSSSSSSSASASPSSLSQSSPPPDPFRPSPGFVIRTQLNILSPVGGADSRKASALESESPPPLIEELDDFGAKQPSAAKPATGERKTLEVLEYFVNVCFSPLVKAPTPKSADGVCTLPEQLDDAFLPISVGFRRLLPVKDKRDTALSADARPEQGGLASAAEKLQAVPLFLDEEEDDRLRGRREAALSAEARVSRVCVDVCVHPLVVQRCKADLRFKAFFATICLRRLMPLEQLLLLQRTREREESANQPCRPSSLLEGALPSERRAWGAAGEEEASAAPSRLSSLFCFVEDEGGKQQRVEDACGFFGRKEREAIEGIAVNAAARGQDPAQLAASAGELVVAPHSLRFPKLLYKGGKEAHLHVLQQDCVAERRREAARGDGGSGKGAKRTASAAGGAREANAGGREGGAPTAKGAGEGPGGESGGGTDEQPREIIMPSAAEVEHLRQDMRRLEEERRRKKRGEEDAAEDLIAAALRAREEAARASSHRETCGRGVARRSGPLIEVLAEEAFPLEREDLATRDAAPRPAADSRRGEAAAEEPDGGDPSAAPGGAGKTPPSHHLGDEKFLQQVTTRRLLREARAASPPPPPPLSRFPCSASPPSPAGASASASAPPEAPPSPSPPSPSPVAASAAASVSALLASSLDTAASAVPPAPAEAPLWRVTHRALAAARAAERGGASPSADAETGEARLPDAREICIAFALPLDPQALHVEGTERELEVSGVMLTPGEEKKTPFCIRVPLPYAIDPDEVEARLKKKKNLLTLLCRPTGL